MCRYVFDLFGFNLMIKDLRNISCFENSLKFGNNNSLKYYMKTTQYFKKRKGKLEHFSTREFKLYIHMYIRLGNRLYEFYIRLDQGNKYRSTKYIFFTVLAIFFDIDEAFIQIRYFKPKFDFSL